MPIEKYPHPGYPIAPPCLRPVLNVSLPVQYAELARAFPTLADLDHRIWAYVRMETAQTLGSLVIFYAESVQQSSFWSRTYFPELPEGLRLEDLKIEQPTYESLKLSFESGVLVSLFTLSRYTFQELFFVIPSFCIKSLIDLLVAVHDHAGAVRSCTQPKQDLSSVDRLSRNDLQRLITQSSDWKTYHSYKLPFLEAASLDDLNASVRTRNCISRLITQGVIKNFRGLSSITLRQMLSCKNFGRRSLLDLLKALYPLVTDYPNQEEVTPTYNDSAEAEGHRHVLDGGEWITYPRLTRSDIEKLGQQPTTLGPYCSSKFPMLPEEASFDELCLSARGQKCIADLIKEGIITNLSDLSGFTVGELLRRRNFGRKSLIELLNAIYPLVLEDEQQDSVERPEHIARAKLSKSLDREAEKLARSRLAKRVRCDDLRLHGLLGPLLFLVNSSSSERPLNTFAALQDLGHRLLTRRRDPVPLSDALEGIQQVRIKIAGLMRKKLEEELRAICTVCVKGERNQDVVLQYLGWMGDPPKTLQGVGDMFGITRERVRQVSHSFQNAIRRRKVFLPTLEKAITFTIRQTPTTADRLETDLCARGLSKSCFRVESIIGAAGVFGILLPFVLDTSRDSRLVVRAENRGLARLIRLHASRAISKYGMTNVADLTDRLAESISTITEAIVEDVVRALPSYDELGAGWFWLREVPRNHLFTVICKVLAVAPRVHVGELRAAIASDPHGMGFSPPKEAVLRFCRIGLQCLIDDGEFVSTQGFIDPIDVLSEAELIILDVLRIQGPLIHRSEFERLCMQRGMNRITFNLYLNRSAILAKYAPGIYGLRGVTFSPGDLEGLIPQHRPRFADHGWTEDAQPWIAVELSPSALSTGVIHVPAGVRDLVQGRYAIKTDDGQNIGNLVVSEQAGWGLAPLFRRRGGEPGDILSITFDVRQREVNARLGDATIIPESPTFSEEISG